jgi:hypothetical protein
MNTFTVQQKYTTEEIIKYLDGDTSNIELDNDIQNNNLDRLSARTVHIECARRNNRLESGRKTISLKQHAKNFDEAYPTDEAYEAWRTKKAQSKTVEHDFSETTLQELCSIIHTGSAANDNISADYCVAASDELKLRDEGLYQIVLGLEDRDFAQLRLAHLNSILGAIFTPARRETLKNYLISTVPELLSSDVESILDFVKDNASRLYRGDLKDSKGFIDFVIFTVLINEAHKRVWLHNITKEVIKDTEKELNIYTKAMVQAIEKELYKVSDLLYDPGFDRDEIFQSTLVLLWEKFWEELKETEGRELKESLYRIARHNARIYTKTITREAVKQRTLKMEHPKEYDEIFPPQESNEEYTGVKSNRGGTCRNV